jgi:hypothetical protein
VVGPFSPPATIRTARFGSTTQGEESGLGHCAFAPQQMSSERPTSARPARLDQRFLGCAGRPKPSRACRESRTMFRIGTSPLATGYAAMSPTPLHWSRDRNRLSRGCCRREPKSLIGTLFFLETVLILRRRGTTRKIGRWQDGSLRDPLIGGDDVYWCRRSDRGAQGTELIR